MLRVKRLVAVSADFNQPPLPPVSALRSIFHNYIGGPCLQFACSYGSIFLAYNSYRGDSIRALGYSFYKSGHAWLLKRMDEHQLEPYVYSPAEVSNICRTMRTSWFRNIYPETATTNIEECGLSEVVRCAHQAMLQ
jgi:hypothetical protein